MVIRLLSLGALFLLLGCVAKPTRMPASNLRGSRPNIIFIFSDDHATHAISSYGSKINETPNIDRLARQGMLFSNFFCGNSICGPSRATILTGLHCHANGFMRNGNRFDPTQVTFPKLLQGAGYQTAMIGKWHLTSDPVGFDKWIVLPGQGQYYNPDFITPQGRKRIEGYCTDITTDLALDWLKTEREPNKPFVLMCQHKAPHRSWMPGPEELGLFRGETIPEPATLFDDYSGRGRACANQEMEIDRHMYMFYDLKLEPTEAERENLKGPDRSWERVLARMNPIQRAAWNAAFRPENAAFRAANLKGRDLVRWKYQRYIKNYLRCVAGVDKSVGQILDHVDGDPKLRDNTIVIYCSDQGFYLGDNGWYDKRWIYEESLRMPFLIRWPEKISAGVRVNELAQNIDLAPTFLDLAGVDVPDSMHGKSLVPLLEERTNREWRDAIYYHYYESHAVHMVGAHYGLRTDRYKLAYFYEPENRYWELFDLQKDPDERSSVYDEPSYAEVREQLKERLESLRAEYQDTTGTLGDFDYTAGVASVDPTDRGYRIRANAWRTYLLRRCEPMLQGQVSLTCTAKPAEPDAGDALLIVTGGAPRQRLFRAGIDFARRRLVVMDGARKAIAETEIRIPHDEHIPITIQADTKTHSMTVTACGQTLRVKLPPAWPGLTAYGYGLSNSTVEFSKIRINAK